MTVAMRVFNPLSLLPLRSRAKTRSSTRDSEKGRRMGKKMRDGGTKNREREYKVLWTHGPDAYVVMVPGMA